MRKTFLLISMIVAGTMCIQAQSSKTVYGELGGSGLVFSANYDMRIGKGEDGFGFRAGLGFAGVSGVSVFTFPVGINYLTGKGPHHLELGFGVTPVTATVSIFDGDNATGTGTFIMPTVGYRYASLGKNGFVGRIYVGPVFAGGETFFPWGGISAGIKF